MNEHTRRASVRTTAVTIIAVILSAIIAIATLLIGFQAYYLGSVAIILCVLIAFAVSFEGRHPRAREIVLIAVMAALAVVARVVFYWIPNFKPTAALVMITGIALGPQAGFLTGAVALFVSNFLFGQGYWTPWQMVVFGLAGLVFGFLAQAGIVKREDLTTKGLVLLALAGGLFTLVIIGPLLDTCSVFLFLGVPSLEGTGAIYLAGVPFNAIHALATAATLALVSNPLLKKIARVRRKFGLSATEPL